MRTFVRQNAPAFWTEARSRRRVEDPRIALRRFESILPPLPSLCPVPDVLYSAWWTTLAGPAEGS